MKRDGIKSYNCKTKFFATSLFLMPVSFTEIIQFILFGRPLFRKITFIKFT